MVDEKDLEETKARIVKFLLETEINLYSRYVNEVAWI